MEEKQVKKIEEIVGKDSAITEVEDRIAYGYDSTRLEYLPDIIVKVKNTEQVSNILKFANEYSIPVTPRGAATGLSGGCLPVKGGILLVMVGMNKIYDVNPVDLLVDVEAGV
ncbi:MAG: FAD-binding oxidoreductase, partial [Candidatus Humimicrobiaceae bacterium]